MKVDLDISDIDLAYLILEGVITIDFAEISFTERGEEVLKAGMDLLAQKYEKEKEEEKQTKQEDH